MLEPLIPPIYHEPHWHLPVPSKFSMDDAILHGLQDGTHQGTLLLLGLILFKKMPKTHYCSMAPPKLLITWVDPIGYRLDDHISLLIPYHTLTIRYTSNIHRMTCKINIYD